MAQGRIWRECTADSERDIISDCGHVRQRASGPAGPLGLY